ncbi:MAG TPA: hypothetical protein VOA41_08995 [Candidatus Dormibacteraeota bacterium]|nr:hypothetical protein [Candidatus Dormibacteraeota bacterium]
MEPTLAPKQENLSLDERIRQHPAAAKTLEKLVKVGCDRADLLRLLAARAPTVRQWSHLQKGVVTEPAQLRTLARKLEATAQAVESIAVETLFGPVFDLKVNPRKIVEDVRVLASSLRHLASSREVRLVRKAFSYRQMGNRLPIVLLCNYVKFKTGKPRFREIAELLSAASQNSVAEDVVRHRADRAVEKLTLNGKFPQLIDAFLALIIPGHSQFRT